MTKYILFVGHILYNIYETYEDAENKKAEILKKNNSYMNSEDITITESN